MHDFFTKVSQAGANNEIIVETSEENLTRVVRGESWRQAGFFWFQGVRVCPFGKSAEILASENIPVSVTMHKDKIKIEGRTA